MRDYLYYYLKNKINWGVQKVLEGLVFEVLGLSFETPFLGLTLGLRFRDSQSDSLIELNFDGTQLSLFNVYAVPNGAISQSTVSQNTISQNTVSQSTISQNTISFRFVSFRKVP